MITESISVNALILHFMALLQLLWWVNDNTKKWIITCHFVLSSFVNTEFHMKNSGALNYDTLRELIISIVEFHEMEDLRILIIPVHV